MLTPLPVDPFIPQIQDALKAARAVIVTAPPGAGKTTRVPPALVPDGAVCPQAGDVVDVQRPLISVSVDEVIWQ